MSAGKICGVHSALNLTMAKVLCMIHFGCEHVAIVVLEGIHLPWLHQEGHLPSVGVLSQLPKSPNNTAVKLIFYQKIVRACSFINDTVGV